MLSYLQSSSDDNREAIYENLNASVPSLKASLSYLAATLASDSLSGCGILQAIRDAKEAQGYLEGGVMTMEAISTVLMNDVFSGATLLNMIFKIEYGSLVGQARFEEEFASLLSESQGALLGFLNTQLGSPGGDI